MFYQGIAEFGIHGGTHAVPSGVDQFHTYSIDWKSTSIVFSIDGRVVRTYNNDANAVSPMTPRGQRWYPTTPSQVQFSVWDGCKAGNNGTCGWSGGPITWTGNAYQSEFEYLDIQCYDDKNQEVPKWPASSPSRQDADATQPTSAAGPLANTGSGAGVYGSATVPVGDANSQTPSLVVIGALALFSLVAVL